MHLYLYLYNLSLHSYLCHFSRKSISVAKNLICWITCQHLKTSGLMHFIFLCAFVFVWFAFVRCVFVFVFLSTSKESHTAVAKKAYVQVTCLAVRYSQKYSYTNTYKYTNIQIYTRIPMRKSPFSLLSVLFVWGWLDGQLWANFQCSKIHLLRLSSVLLTPWIRYSPNCCSVTRKKGLKVLCHQCIAMWSNAMFSSVFQIWFW